jgi:hypothetical protein
VCDVPIHMRVLEEVASGDLVGTSTFFQEYPQQRMSTGLGT